jgi:hypothetical protein
VLAFQLLKELMKEFEKLNLGIVAHTEEVTFEVESVLEQEICKGQLENVEIKEVKETMERDKVPDFTKDDQEMIWFKNRIGVPDVGGFVRPSRGRLMIQLIPFIQAVPRCTTISSRGIGGMGSKEMSAFRPVTAHQRPPPPSLMHPLIVPDLASESDRVGESHPEPPARHFCLGPARLGAIPWSF